MNTKKRRNAKDDLLRVARGAHRLPIGQFLIVILLIVFIGNLAIMKGKDTYKETIDHYRDSLPTQPILHEDSEIFNIIKNPKIKKNTKVTLFKNKPTDISISIPSHKQGNTIKMDIWSNRDNMIKTLLSDKAITFSVPPNAKEIRFYTKKHILTLPKIATPVYVVVKSSAGSTNYININETNNYEQIITLYVKP